MAGSGHDAYLCLMISIAIAEDNSRLASMLRSRISSFEGMEVTVTAPNGSELLKHLHRGAAADVVFMDIHMPVMDGIEATREVSKRWPQVKVIMFTVFDDEEHLFEAILSGAAGYLMKDETGENILAAIHEALEGGAPMSPGIARKALALIRSGKPRPKPEEDFGLTPRETEILEHLSKGLSYDQVAGNFGISTGTVRKHIEHIYRKLQVTNKVEAVQKAMQKGIMGKG
jgi:DNA-binding NarL/FixJ family response regulator